MPIRIPNDSTIRLQHRDGAWIVAVTRAGGPEALPGFDAILSHDRGLSWPDATGEALASAVLARPGGTVFLAFDGLAEALACRKRLTGRAA